MAAVSHSVKLLAIASPGVVGTHSAALAPDTV